MTTIRDIACDEVPLLLDGARTFFAEGGLLGALNPRTFVEGWQRLLASGSGMLLGVFRERQLIGAIGGVIHPDFVTGEVVAQEMFWFMLPGERGSGIRLFKQYELKAALRGAKRILMVHLADLNDDAMGKLYGRMGYAMMEKIYAKNI